MSSQQQRRSTNIFYVLGLGCELGFLIAFPLVICIIVGIAVDRRLNTFPLILIASILVGIILTVADVYKIILPFLEKRSSNSNKINNNKQV
jgi:F0F1-type ATP synthase assembly protein I